MTDRHTAGCGGCDRRWTSLDHHHCVTCHRQFEAIEGFDAHRRRGKCFPPHIKGRTSAPNHFEPFPDDEGGVVWRLVADERAGAAGSGR